MNLILRKNYKIILIIILLFSFFVLGMYVEKGIKKKIIFTENAPKPIGPYSQAVMFGNTLYLSGQLGMDPKTGSLPTTIEEQTKNALENLKAVLEKADMNFKNIVQTHIFLKDINDFQKVNEIYASYFQGEFPARATMQVAALPKDGKVEIEMIACKE